MFAARWALCYTLRMLFLKATVFLCAVGMWCGGLLPLASAADPLAEAWDELGFLNYGAAVKGFKSVLKKADAGSQAWIDANLGLAMSLHQRQPDAKKDKERAAELFEVVVDAAPGSRARAFALLGLGRLADQIDYFGDEPDRATARTYYDQLIAEFKELPLIHQAALYRAQLGVLAMNATTAQVAVDELRAWLTDHAGNPLAAHQWMLIGRAMMYPLERPADAVLAFVTAEKVGLPPNTKLDAYYWLVANLAEEAGDTATAVTFYRRIIEEVQRTGYAYEAQVRIRKLGVEPPPLVDPFTEEEQP